MSLELDEETREALSIPSAWERMLCREDTIFELRRATTREPLSREELDARAAARDKKRNKRKRKRNAAYMARKKKRDALRIAKKRAAAKASLT